MVDTITLFGLMGFLNAVVTFIVAVFVYFKDRSNLIYRGFAYFTVPIALWSFFYSIFLFQPDYHKSLLLIQTGVSCCYFIPYGFLWFVKVLVAKGKAPRFGFLYFFIPAFFAAFGYSKYMISDIKPKLFFYFWTDPGPLLHIFLISYAFCLVIAFYLLFSNWRKSKGAHRRKIAIVTVTTLLAWAGGSTNWFLWYDIPVAPYPNFFVALFIAILAYAILARGMFDIDDLVRFVREGRLSALGMLSASMNHEIRNPLYIIQGLAESHLANIRDGRFHDHKLLEEKTCQTLNKSVEQVNRALAIMKQFSSECYS